jgi:hypothetical protein
VVFKFGIVLESETGKVHIFSTGRFNAEVMFYDEVVGADWCGVPKTGKSRRGISAIELIILKVEQDS